MPSPSMLATPHNGVNLMDIWSRILPILMPEAQIFSDVINDEKSRLIYYTSAETAQKILDSEEIWMRNASVMNDRKEILHGVELIRATLQSSAGIQLEKLINQTFPGALMRVKEAIQNRQYDWISGTFIACPSMYNRDEDENGRLSMWRAYGNVAFVIRTTPMKQSTLKLGVFSTPVLYLGELEAKARIELLVEVLRENADYLNYLNDDIFCNFAFEIMRYFAIAAKHPQFKEEREVRLYYQPSHQMSPAMKKRTVTIDGVLQTVWALPLQRCPEKELFADIPSILDRIIVGPMENQQICASALVDLLTAAGVNEAHNKVVLSDIPLRPG